MTRPQEATKRLREGNRRFVSGESWQALYDSSQRAELASAQRPFAIVLGCSDSRVAPEPIFDQGLGDLFVVRAAGHVATATLIGSIEFAVEQFDTSLIVVLGHSMCGAVEATIEVLKSAKEPSSPNLSKLLKGIRPAVEPLMEAASTPREVDLLERSIQANIHATVRHLSDRSQFLAERIEQDKLHIVGAHYSLETGAVDFLEGSTQDA